jgi:transposase
MREPQEIEDREHEQAVLRVAAVDVAKASGVVCTRVPREGGRGFVTKVWPVEATTGAILELADHLAGLAIEKVVLDSTSDYWRPFFYLLEAAGLDVALVNARDVKNAPGRPKTGKLDAVWLAKLAGWGMLRPSFVPPPEIRRLRDYTRLRIDLTRERTRHWQRLGKLLEDALIKITAVASRIDTMPVRDMVEALIAGQRDPHRLADLARGKMKAKRAALVRALDGRFDDHHGELAEIPGISRDAAQVIIAEVGLDMTRFPTAAHLVSWARLCPRILQSGARERPGRTAKGNPYLKGVLGNAAAAAGKTDTFLGERYRRLARRRGKLKAVVAIARTGPGRAPAGSRL